MGARYLTDLADVCRRAGLVVHEDNGWQTRARSSGGYDSGRPNHVMVHHTASNTSPANDVNYICRGADAAPIANLYLARTGEVWVCAAGATNTNGSGIDPCGHAPNDSMNTHAVGIEAASSGLPDSVWPPEQQDAYVRLVRALCDAYGVPESRIHTHHSYAPSRKIDPAGPAQWPPINSSGTWNEDAFQASVASSSGTTPTPEEDEMKWQLLQDSRGVWITDGITRRAMAPADIQRYAALGLVDMVGPNAKVSMVNDDEIDRMQNVSPPFPPASSEGAPIDYAALAKAVNDDASKRMAQ